jgi:tetratricopeptide (TPR) repeat protein
MREWRQNRQFQESTMEGETVGRKEARAWLEEADERRYDDPEGVYAELLARPDVPDGDLPLWFGVAGSCLRLMDQLEDAEATLRAALGLPWLTNCQAGDLYQRLSLVFWNAGSYEKAMTENAQAVALFVEVDCQIGLGRSLVDRGLFHYEAEATDRAKWVLQRAIDILPRQEKKHLAAANHGLALCAIRAQNPTEALAYADEARRFQLDDLNRGKLEWLLGVTFSKLGKRRQANEMFISATETLARISPINAALCTIDHCEVLLAWGRGRAAHRVASGMAMFVGALRNTRQAQAATIELARIGLRGKGLTRALLAEYRARVSHAAR